jgi:hypothetical protein
MRHEEVSNPVVLTGDAHMHHAATLRPDFGDPGSPAVATELVTSSISSDGDGYRDQACAADARCSLGERFALLQAVSRAAVQRDRPGARVCPFTVAYGEATATKAGQDFAAAGHKRHQRMNRLRRLS